MEAGASKPLPSIVPQCCAGAGNPVFWKSDTLQGKGWEKRNVINNSSPVCIVTGEHRAPVQSPDEILLHRAVLCNAGHGTWLTA